jgi:Ca2+-binding RTX toxin-like protein
MATDPLVPARTPFNYNVGINYETWMNGRTGYSITKDLDQITKYFGLIKTYHDAAVGTSNPTIPKIEPTEQTVISYVAKTSNLQLVMGTNGNALAQGGFGTPWSAGLMTSLAYTDKWVQMVIKAFGTKQAVLAHLKMVQLGNEIDANGPPPGDPEFNSYKTWITQSFENLKSSLQKAGLGSIPISTTIANYGPSNAISVLASTYIPQHWSAAWNGGKPIVFYNQYTPAVGGKPMSGTDYQPVIDYFKSVYKQVGTRLEPFIGETGYSTFYGQANQVKVYNQINAWLTGQYNSNGHKTVPLFMFDAFDQPSQEPAVEKSFGIFSQNAQSQPTGLKPGLTLPSWTKNSLQTGGFQSVQGVPNQLVGDVGSDMVSYAETPGTVYADLRAQAGYVDGVLTDMMVSIENLTGGSGTNTLVGDEDANTLVGGNGNDYLYGLGGDDVLIGGGATAGNPNQLWGGDGSDTVSFADVTGTLYADLRIQAGYVGGDLTDVMNSIENLVGGSNTNTLVGNDGANVLTGGDGTDYLYGMGGDDALLGGAAPVGNPNQLWGGAGSDTASYLNTTGAVFADLGAQAGYVDGVLTDTMNSIENLVGSWGNDTLVGNGGANLMAGGAGADVLWGKGGADTFVYTGYGDSNLETGYDTVADFVSGTSKLDLSSLVTDASHVVITSDSRSTSVYVEMTAGTFDATTDLAISFVGGGAIAMADIKF